MRCVALAGRALAICSCYMQSMLFYSRFSQKCEATERLMLFSGEPFLKDRLQVPRNLSTLFQ